MVIHPVSSPGVASVAGVPQSLQNLAMLAIGTSHRSDCMVLVSKAGNNEGGGGGDGYPVKELVAKLRIRYLIVKGVGGWGGGWLPCQGTSSQSEGYTVSKFNG